MSGPKRADVQLQLNIVAGSIRKSSALLHSNSSANIKNIVNNSEKNIKVANDKLIKLVAIFNELSRNNDEESKNDILRLRKDIEDAKNSLVKVKDTINLSVDIVSKSEKEIKEAENIFIEAERRGREIEEAIRNKPHYCHDEMRQAQELCVKIEKAQVISKNANIRSKGAENNVLNSAMNINELARRLSLLIDKANKINQGVIFRDKARKESELIKEKKKKEAKVNLENVKSSMNNINIKEDIKLVGDKIQGIIQEVAILESNYEDGNYDFVNNNSTDIVVKVKNISEEVLVKRKEIEEKSAIIEENINAIESMANNIGKDIIENWVDNKGVVLEINQVIEKINNLKEALKLDEAVKVVVNLKENVAKEIEKAIKNIEDNDKRENTGRVIMEVLHDMGFDVSFDNGDLNNPMQISAQTVDINGRGDVEVSLPLEGEIDFHVETTEGDVSCIAAIKELEERLRERGVNWNTTDWGHASGVKVIKSTIKEKVTEKTKIKLKNS